MFAIKVEDKYLGIPTGQTFTLIKNSELFSADLPEGEYSYPINLNIKDPNVSAFFSSLRNIQSVKTFKSVDCQLYFKKQPLENNARLVFRKRKGSIVQGFILTGSSILAQALKNTKVNDIDFGTIYIGDTHQLMVDHMKHTVTHPHLHNHVFAPVFAPNFKEKYGDGSNLYDRLINNYATIGQIFLQNEDFKMMHYTAYVPFIKLTFVLEKLFDFFGFSVNWPLMNQADFQKIVLVNNAELNVEYPGNFYGFKARNTANYTIFSRQNVLIFNDDTSTGMYNDGGFWNASLQHYDVVHASGKYVFSLDITAVMDDEITISEPDAFIQVEVVEYLFNVEIILDNVILQRVSVLVVREFADLPVTISEIINIEVELPFTAVGKRITVRGYFSDIPAFPSEFKQTLIQNSILTLNIENPPKLYVLKQDIEYRQHLPEDDCSEFLNNIRKRFGAYVSKIDFENKVIHFDQVNKIANKSSSKPLFENRDVEDEFEINFNRFLFIEEFNDDKLAENPVYTDLINNKLEVGSDLDDAEINEITLKYSPVFHHFFFNLQNNKFGYPAIGIEGKPADYEGAECRLAFYHGMHPNSDANTQNIPFVAALNRNILNVKIADFSLTLNYDVTLWDYFLKAWYSKRFTEETYTFDIAPNLQEIKAFNFEDVDFYEFALFASKKVEFKIQNNKILKSTFEAMKLNR